MPFVDRYFVPHDAHVADAGASLPLASLMPHEHIQPLIRPGLPTISA